MPCLLVIGWWWAGLLAGDDFCRGTEQQKVVPSSIGAGATFGLAVGLDADLAVVGSMCGVSRPGHSAVFFLRRSSGSWSVRQRVPSPTGGPDDGFGHAVALQGDRALVGAPLHDDPAAPGGGVDAGQAYHYRYVSGLWKRIQPLAPADLAAGDRYGEAVATDQDVVAVGAPGALGQRGALYVYRLAGNLYVQEQKITLAGAVPGDHFGAVLDVGGNWLAVGQPGQAAVHLFQHDGVSWIPAPGPLSGTTGFGTAVALAANQLAVGSPDSPPAGAVHVFAFDGAGWSPTSVLTPPSPAADAGFGTLLALHTDQLAITTRPAGGSSPGGVHLYRWAASQWSEVQRVATSSGALGDDFGSAVAVDRDELLVGAPLDAAQGADAGAIYSFAVPELGLQGTGTLIGVGDLVEFCACGGQPGALVMLFLVASPPNLLPMTPVGVFDASGGWGVAGSLCCSPGLASADFQAYMLEQGKLIGSTPWTLHFQLP